MIPPSGKLNLTFSLGTSIPNSTIPPCNSKLNDQELFPPVFVITLHSTQVLLSLSAIFANFFVTAILSFKDKLSATELLVFIHSLLDGSYGLYLFVGAVCSLLNLFDQIKCSYPISLCVFTYGFHTFFVFSSLILALTITINRYIAVEHPFDYKIWCTRFRTGFVVAGAAIIGALATVPEILLCAGNASFTTIWEDAYVIYWYCARSGLTIICCFASALLFRSISKQFNKSTWLSTLVPFKYKLHALVRNNSSNSKCLVCDGQTPSDNNAGSKTNKKNEIEMKEKKGKEGGGADEDRLIEVIGVREQRQPGDVIESCVDDNVEIHNDVSSDKSANSNTGERPRIESVIDTTKRDSVTEITLSVPVSNVKCSLSTEHTGSIVSPAVPTLSTKDVSRTNGNKPLGQISRTSDKNKLGVSPIGVKPGVKSGVIQTNTSSSSSADSKKRVTATLFYVTVFFIIISTPVATVELFQNVFGLINLSPVASQILTLSTETLFCANFFLSAYLFIFNNSYIHEKLRSWKPCMR